MKRVGMFTAGLLMSFSFSFNLYAAKDSAPIELAAGELKPKEILSISLASLDNEIYYKIKCDIVNPNYGKKYPIVVRAYCDGNCSRISINGSNWEDGRYGILKKYVNKFEIEYIKYINDTESNIYIQSFDDSDTATVTNCMAYYAVE